MSALSHRPQPAGRQPEALARIERIIAGTEKAPKSWAAPVRSGYVGTRASHPMLGDLTFHRDCVEAWEDAQAQAEAA